MNASPQDGPSRRDHLAADNFMERLAEGSELKRRHPILTLREKLRSDARLNQNEQLKAVIMAWNNWRRGQNVNHVTHSVAKGEKLPEPV